MSSIEAWTIVGKQVGTVLLYGMPLLLVFIGSIGVEEEPDTKMFFAFLSLLGVASYIAIATRAAHLWGMP